MEFLKKKRSYPEYRKKKVSNEFYHQTGKIVSVVRDVSIKAKTPGWRKSKAGSWYWESRKNRSDARGGRI